METCEPELFICEPEVIYLSTRSYLSVNQKLFICQPEVIYLSTRNCLFFVRSVGRVQFLREEQT